MSHWRNYWNKQKHGQHRSQDKDFLARKAQDQLSLLTPGDTLLDFGCGVAELLVYMAPQYQQVTGVDFSAILLARARHRATLFKCDNIDFIEADDANVWERIGNKNFDHIICTEVVQYFTPEQMLQYIDNALIHLNPGGSILLAGCIDPALLPKWRRGDFVPWHLKPYYILKNMARSLVIKWRKLRNLEPVDPIGAGHTKAWLQEQMAHRDVCLEIFPATVCEYRYHAVIKRR